MHRAYTEASVLVIVRVPSSVSTFIYEMLSVIVCGSDPLPSRLSLCRNDFPIDSPPEIHLSLRHALRQHCTFTADLDIHSLF